MNNIKDKFIVIDKVKINKRNYKIRLNSGLSEEILGETTYSLAIIDISTSILKDLNLVYSTIIHEFVHAYLFEYGMYDNNYNNENICNFFGAYGRDIIKVSDRILNKIILHKKRG